jgi:hypothetical protein
MGFNVLHPYMYRKNINHIHPPLPSSFSLSLPLLPSPENEQLTIQSYIVLEFLGQWGFALSFYL